MIEAAVFALILFAVVAIVVGAMVTRSIERNRQRGLLHQERMTALQDRELPVEDLAHLFQPPTVQPSTADRWIRLFAVGVGLILLFGGTALLTGLLMITDPEVQQFWGLGLIPMFIGAGLLLFAVIASHSAFKLAPNDPDRTAP